MPWNWFGRSRTSGTSAGTVSADEREARRPPARPIVREGGGVTVTVTVPGERDPKKALEKVRELTGAR